MAPKPSYCGEKERLLDAYLAASHEVFRLQDEELTRFSHGGEVDGFALTLSAARAKRDAAKAACMEHIAEHGC